MCASANRYNVNNAKFPYDPEERLLDANGEDMHFVKYYRYLATDICATTTATAIAMGETPEISPGEEAVAAFRLAKKTGQGTKSKSKTSAQKPKARFSFSAKKSNKMALDLAEEEIKLEAKESLMNRVSLSLKTYLNGPGHRSIMLVLTLINIAQLGMYGTGSGIGVLESVLDTISFLFLIWGFVEIGLRIGCVGWRDFWHVNNDFFQQAANRFDFNINLVTFLVLILCMSIKASNNEPMWFTPWDSTPGETQLRIQYPMCFHSVFDWLGIHWFFKC